MGFTARSMRTMGSPTTHIIFLFALLFSLHDGVAAFYTGCYQTPCGGTCASGDFQHLARIHYTGYTACDGSSTSKLCCNFPITTGAEWMSIPVSGRHDCLTDNPCPAKGSTYQSTSECIERCKELTLHNRNFTVRRSFRKWSGL